MTKMENPNYREACSPLQVEINLSIKSQCQAQLLDGCVAGAHGCFTMTAEIMLGVLEPESCNFKRAQSLVDFRVPFAARPTPGPWGLCLDSRIESHRNH